MAPKTPMTNAMYQDEAKPPKCSNTMNMASHCHLRGGTNKTKLVLDATNKEAKRRTAKEQSQPDHDHAIGQKKKQQGEHHEEHAYCQVIALGQAAISAIHNTSNKT